MSRKPLFIAFLRRHEYDTEQTEPDEAANVGRWIYCAPGVPMKSQQPACAFEAARQRDKRDRISSAKWRECVSEQARA